jgi:hypothetical protein
MFINAIHEGDQEKYNHLIKQVASVITNEDWDYLLNHCNEISVLPVYWKYIPDSIKANFRFIELYTTEEKRTERALKRGLTETDLKMYDKFWIDPPFVDERILI